MVRARMQTCLFSHLSIPSLCLRERNNHLLQLRKRSKARRHVPLANTPPLNYTCPVWQEPWTVSESHFWLPHVWKRPRLGSRSQCSWESSAEAGNVSWSRKEPTEKQLSPKSQRPRMSWEANLSVAGAGSSRIDWIPWATSWSSTSSTSTA